MSTQAEEPMEKENNLTEFSKSDRSSPPPPTTAVDTQGIEDQEVEDEVAKITQKSKSEAESSHEQTETMPQCEGVLGDFERRTCANPNTTLEEIEFRKKSDGSRLRIRPRSPIAQKPRRNRTSARRIRMKNDDPRFAKKLKKLTKKFSPVCGDDTLAIFMMKGYNYQSPMSRNTSVAIYDSEDSVSDNELGIEPNVCDSCLFCSRDGVRHHKDKKNENRLIRRVRSPCRCYHTCIQEDEENGKNFIMERFLRQKLDDFSPELQEDEKPKRESEEKLEEPVAKLPRLATEEDITEKRKEIKDKMSKSSNSSGELEVVASPAPVQKPEEEEKIEVVQIESSQPKVEEPKKEFVQQVVRKSCHAPTHGIQRPLRVSVIQPTRSHTSGQSSNTGDFLPRAPSMVSSTTPSEKMILQQYKQFLPTRSPYQNHTGNETVTVKVENQDDRYVRPQYPPSIQSGSSGPSQFRHQRGSQGASWSSQFSSLGSQPNEMLIKQPYSGSCHQPSQLNRMNNSLSMPGFPVQQHAQNAYSSYSQDSLSQRMIRPGHPQHIRACIERLAAGLQVSRHVAEQNENQVTELLRLACDVRREVDCDTFYCTWRDCVKSFNRRDSLVRHLRVHVNVRPFKCERCGTPFLRSDHLRVHMLRHTGEQPFACIVCGVTFSRKDMRNRHMKTTHYRDTTPPQRVLDLLEGESWDAIEVDNSAQPH